MNARYIDFHSHFYDPTWFSSPATIGQGILVRAWPPLTDIEAQLAAMDDTKIDAKVLTASSALLTEPGKQLPATLIERINDRFAELVSTYHERLLALATIVAFRGESAVLEVERAIQELGPGGICVDCSQGDRFLDAPEARPTLVAAVKLGVIVFVSPVGLTERLSRLGQTGTLLARGTENAASLLALLRSGILDELPELKVVLPIQSTPFFRGLTVSENLTLFANFYGVRLSRQQVTELLARCGLTEVARTEASRLSGGQQKRLAIALTLSHQPRLIFLDEPTSTLDPRARHEIRELIRSLATSGTTIVFASHDMEEVGKLADRVVLIAEERRPGICFLSAS